MGKRFHLVRLSEIGVSHVNRITGLKMTKSDGRIAGLKKKLKKAERETK